jgi:hypothetical protein
LATLDAREAARSTVTAGRALAVATESHGKATPRLQFVGPRARSRARAAIAT